MPFATSRVTRPISSLLRLSALIPQPAFPGRPLPCRSRMAPPPRACRCPSTWCCPACSPAPPSPQSTPHAAAADVHCECCPLLWLAQTGSISQQLCLETSCCVSSCLDTVVYRQAMTYAFMSWSPFFVVPAVTRPGFTP